MAARAPLLLRLIAVLVLAPILAAVIIATLLLFGAEPHLVFLPGHFVKSTLARFGFPAPNSVGVLSTVAVWWAVVMAVWLTLRRWRRGPRSPDAPG